MAAMGLTSRFDVLKVQATIDPDKKTQPKPNTTNKQKSADGGKSTADANAKKRARKKKKQQQLQAERDELRDMTFMNSHKPSGPAHHSSSTSNQGLPETQRAANQQPVSEEDWKKWLNRDEEVVDSQFEKDLQLAILESKLTFEERQTFLSEVGDAGKDETPQPLMNRKERRKHLQKEKPHAMSLQKFHTSNPSEGVGLDNIDLPPDPAQAAAKKAELSEPDPKFFNKVEDEVTHIIKKDQRKKKKEGQKKEDEGEVVRRIQYEDELQRKDQEIEELRSEVDKFKTELAQVKKRNKQLCFILAQGEMKDKADVLKQVEELTAVKDELTEEVAELHAALEQERSKVSSLKSELQKQQDRKK